MVCITTFRASNSESKEDFDELTILPPPKDPVFVALGSLDSYEISSRAGQALPLRVGMKGDAHIIVGGRTLIKYAFEPIRQLRESIRL